MAMLKTPWLLRMVLLAILGMIIWSAPEVAGFVVGLTKGSGTGLARPWQNSRPCQVPVLDGIKKTYEMEKQFSGLVVNQNQGGLGGMMNLDKLMDTIDKNKKASESKEDGEEEEEEVERPPTEEDGDGENDVKDEANKGGV